jgi:hypothetical protein
LFRVGFGCLFTVGLNSFWVGLFCVDLGFDLGLFRVDLGWFGVDLGLVYGVSFDVFLNICSGLVQGLFWDRLGFE